MVSKYFRYIYLLVVFNFFFLLERGTKRKEREGKKKFSLSPLSSLLFSLLPFFHFNLFFTHPSSFGGFVSQREEKRKFGERIKEKRGEIDNDARDGMNPIIREQRWSKRT